MTETLATALQSPCLSDAEIFGLTRKKQLAAQARVLDALSIPYRRRPDGTIVVFRDILYHAPPQNRPPSPCLRLPT